MSWMSRTTEAVSPEALERVLFEAVALEPDSVRIDEPDWVQVRTPSSRRANHNAVIVARLEGNVEDRVRAVVAEHHDSGTRMRWFVGPSTRPTDLVRHLEAAGLGLLGHSLGMTKAVPEDGPTAADGFGVAGLTLRQMTPDNVEDFVDITKRGWQQTDAFAEAVRYIAMQSFTPESTTRSYIADLDGKPVASSHLRLLPGLGYFQGSAVLPDFRHRGIYRALIEHRLSVLRGLGIPTAVVWAEASGSGVVCGKSGFETICEGDFYESPVLDRPETT